jgi:hypothetical protein
MDATEQAVDTLTRITLQGTEFALRLSGAGAKNLIALLYAVAADQKKTQGKTRLSAMLKSGKPLKVFQIDTSDLKAFAKEARRYGVLYTIIKARGAVKDGRMDVMATADDAAKINRIVEKLALGTVDVADVVADIEREREGAEPEDPIKDAQELITDLLRGPQAEIIEAIDPPTQARTDSPLPSGPISDERGPLPKAISDTDKAFEDDMGPIPGKPDDTKAVPERARRSVKALMEEIRAKRREGQKASEQPAKSQQTRHGQSKKRTARKSKSNHQKGR